MADIKQAQDKILDHIFELEGGYVNDPSDSGGETNWGITIKVARDFGYKGDMKDLPKELAREIYIKNYWDPLKLDEIIPILGFEVGDKLMNIGVNTGIGTASQFLQQSLNVSDTGKDDLEVDGVIGPKTMASVESLSPKFFPIMFRMLNCLQGNHYIHLATKRPKDKKFIRGWFLRRVS